MYDMQPQLPPITPTVRTLLVVLVVFFLGQTAAEGLLGIPLTQWAALFPGVHVELAWQWATYWLVAVIAQPGDVFWHLVSLFAIYWVLSMFEAEHGRRRLLGLDWARRARRRGAGHRGPRRPASAVRQNQPRKQPQNQPQPQPDRQARRGCER